METKIQEKENIKGIQKLRTKQEHRDKPTKTELTRGGGAGEENQESKRENRENTGDEIRRLM